MSGMYDASMKRALQQQVVWRRPKEENMDTIFAWLIEAGPVTAPEYVCQRMHDGEPVAGVPSAIYWDTNPYRAYRFQDKAVAQYFADWHVGRPVRVVEHGFDKLRAESEKRGER